MKTFPGLWAEDLRGLRFPRSLYNFQRTYCTSNVPLHLPFFTPWTNTSSVVRGTLMWRNKRRFGKMFQAAKTSFLNGGDWFDETSVGRSHKERWYHWSNHFKTDEYAILKDGKLFKNKTCTTQSFPPQREVVIIIIIFFFNLVSLLA